MSNNENNDKKPEGIIFTNSSSVFVHDAPTPFMTDDNALDAIMYDKHQITFVAYTIGALPLRKSTLELVWNELCAYWRARGASEIMLETRDEHIICAAHGWTLDEVYLWMFEGDSCTASA